jgi:hypothetical protein
MKTYKLTRALMMLDATHSALLESEAKPVPRLIPYLTALVRALHFINDNFELTDVVSDYLEDHENYYTLLEFVESLMSELSEEVL